MNTTLVSLFLTASLAASPALFAENKQDPSQKGVVNTMDMPVGPCVEKKDDLDTRGRKGLLLLLMALSGNTPIGKDDFKSSYQGDDKCRKMPKVKQGVPAKP